MSESLLDGLIVYGSSLLISLMCILIGYLLLKNDALRPYVGIRTQKGLDDPEWRRRAEKLAGRWYLRLGVIWTILSIILFLFARHMSIETPFMVSAVLILGLPLFALRTK